jgi:hypothetical protein
MRKFLLIMVIFVFVALLVSCDQTQATQSETTTSASESVAETTVVEATVPTTVTETAQEEVKKEFSLSVAGDLFISDAYISDIWVEGDYAFISTWNTFKVIDVADKQNPQIINNLSVKGGYGFCVKGNYAYLPYQIWDQSSNKVKETGVEIVDISDQKNPKIAGEYKLSQGTIANIFITDNYLFISYRVEEIKDNYYSIAESGFEMIDISVKESPNLVKRYAEESRNGLSYLCADNSYAYIFNDNYLKVIDVADKDNLVETGKVYLPIWSYLMSSEENFLYVVSNNAIEIIDIADKENPVLIGGFFAKGDVSSVFILDDYAFVNYSVYSLPYGEQNNRDLLESGLQIVDISEKESLKPVAEIKIDGEVTSIFVSGNYAYVGTGSTGFKIVKLFEE